MKKFRIIIFVFVSIICFFSNYIACEKLPEEPSHNNLIDPENPTSGGDPFLLQVTIGNGGITLNWNQSVMEVLP
jgi:hypothetical protein